MVVVPVAVAVAVTVTMVGGGGDGAGAGDGGGGNDDDTEARVTDETGAHDSLTALAYRPRCARACVDACRQGNGSRVTA